MTTFSPLLLVSAQLANASLFFEMSLQQNKSKFLTKITGLSSETSSIDGISFSTHSCSRMPYGESPSITRHDWQWEIDQIISRQTILCYTEEIHLRYNKSYGTGGVNKITLDPTFTYFRY